MAALNLFKMPSMSFPFSNNPHVLLPPRTTTTSLPVFNEKQQTHNWNGLKFIRGKKLLKDLTSWAIGGPGNYFLQVSDQTQLVSAIRYCHEHSIRYIIIGKGSNCLFDDLGFDGCVILNRIEFLESKEAGMHRVGSGFRFNRLGIHCSNQGFTGLEFAGAIPATVGGATYMNAGANAQETGDVIYSVDVVTVQGKLQRLEKNDLNFGYRSSTFQDMKDLAAIVAFTFQLQERRTTQPLGERTAGSVFRNPLNVGVAAAELIEKAGLKGFRIGGAVTSVTQLLETCLI
ncbi:hypothetical protein LWI29_029589 [Acer saccharum]|uniref:UDP-N-acetylmuramate dehydrogenase n=1 Tax=Acer saccharum TaxID=4024 RepID=A0AA39W0S3_ACESA|nr:hypothetical protein LWI29_029589 [Acer saccharum]